MSRNFSDKECLLFYALVPSLNFPICKYHSKIKEKSYVKTFWCKNQHGKQDYYKRRQEPECYQLNDKLNQLCQGQLSH